MFLNKSTHHCLAPDCSMSDYFTGTTNPIADGTSDCYVGTTCMGSDGEVKIAPCSSNRSSRPSLPSHDQVQCHSKNYRQTSAYLLIHFIYWTHCSLLVMDGLKYSRTSRPSLYRDHLYNKSTFHCPKPSKTTKINLCIKTNFLLRPPNTCLKGGPNREVLLYNISM